MINYIKINDSNFLIGHHQSPSRRPVSNPLYIVSDDIKNYTEFINHFESNGKSYTWKSGDYKYTYNSSTKSIEISQDATRRVNITIVDKTVQEGTNVVMNLETLRPNGRTLRYTGELFFEISEEDGDVLPFNVPFTAGKGTINYSFPQGKYNISQYAYREGISQREYVVGDLSFIVYN